MFIGFMAWKFKFVYMVEMGGVELGLVNDKDKFEKDIKDTLENLEEPVVSAKLQENPKYSLRLVDKDDIDVDDNYVFAKVEEKIEKTYRYYNIKEDDKLLAKVSTKEEKDNLLKELKEAKQVKDLKVEEEKTKEYYIISYEEAKQLASTNVDNIENEKKNKLEKEKIEKRNTNIVKNIRRGGTVSASSSSNASAMLGSLSFRRPLNSSRVSAGYLGYPGHRGIDFPSPQGTPVMAAESGTVTTVMYSNKSYGNRVIIDHGNGISTLYGHNSTIGVSLGQKVSKGQTIAGVGSTGNSTGNHVHFEIRINGKPINPTSYVM
jgi:hypothetical protein